MGLDANSFHGVKELVGKINRDPCQAGTFVLAGSSLVISLEEVDEVAPPPAPPVAGTVNAAGRPVSTRPAMTRTEWNLISSHFFRI